MQPVQESPKIQENTPKLQDDSSIENISNTVDKHPGGNQLISGMTKLIEFISSFMRMYLIISKIDSRSKKAINF